MILEDNDEEEEREVKKLLVNELAAEHLIPQLTKEGYYMDPSIQKLSRMTEKQLSEIEEFTIYNSHAKVIFDGFTDVRSLNIDKIVSFSEKCVNLFNLFIKLTIF